MLSSKICCHKVSLYLPPSLYNFHNLRVDCRTFPLSIHRFSNAVLCPHEPDLKNISTDSEPIQQCDKVARIYTSLLVYTSIWGKILLFYSYFCDLFVFLWFGPHFTRCELFEPDKSYGNDSSILKQSKNMLLNFELHRSTMNLHQKNVLIYALLS